MKKVLFLCCLIAMGLNSWAAGHETTTDHLTISELTLDPGGEVGSFDISLEGSQLYTAFGFDLYLPEGYEFDRDGSDDWNNAIDASVEDYSIYPYTSSRGKKTYSHTLSANIQSDGALRITTLSQLSAELTANSGVIVTVYVKATSYAKPGYGDVRVKKCFFVTSEGIQYDTDDETISDKLSASSSATASMTVSASNQWSTCILPFDAELPDGVLAYTCSTKDDVTYKLNLSPASSLEAYTPYILYSADGYTGTLTGTVDAALYPENGYVESGLLRGAITKQSIDYGYVLQNLGEGAMFYACGGSTFTIPAGKCWMKYVIGNSAKAYAFSIEDTPTAVNNVSGVSAEGQNCIYNLAGQKVSSDYKGIVIKNGKKFTK